MISRKNWRQKTRKIDHETFGIDLGFVIEIIGIQTITYVPEVPDYVKGIINLRGKIIPVIDMRLRFKKQAMEYNDRTCIIVIDVRNITIGLIVDYVAEVVKISDDNIAPPPNYRAGFHNPYIKGIGKSGNDVKLLLDCEKIISDEEFDVLGEMNK